jgi:DUF4097 and DUF4098 domain-containing protein YvlB
MKLLKIYIAVISVLLFTNAALVDNNISDVRRQSFSVSKGGTLNVNVDPGNIQIETWDKDEVYIKVSGLDEDDLNEIEMEKRGNEVIVRSDSDWGEGPEYSFSVPNNFHLKIKTTGGNIRLLNDLIGRANLNTSGGNVTTENLQGELAINTSGGNIRVGNISGNLQANTSGGNITTGILKGKSAQLNTSGGNIKVEQTESRLSAKTYGGQITIGDIGSDADVATFGGNIRLGKVNGNVKMQTFGGNLTLNSANGSVNAETMGGNIEMTKVNGSVNAETAGGNILVGLIPDGNESSLLETAGGDIELQLPANAKVKIDAIIYVSGSWNDDSDEYKITSDFESIQYDIEKDEIRAIYEPNGGGPVIKLRTNNSNISIKKM